MKTPNIVAHIYDKEKTYTRNVISWRRIFLLPIKLLVAICEKDLENFCIIAEKVTGTFVGRIIEESWNKFIVEIYPTKPIIIKQIWHNIYTLALPTYKKKVADPPWFPPENGYVAYIPFTRKMYNFQVLNRKQFLELINQSNKNFIYNESIKYSGC